MVRNFYSVYDPLRQKQIFHIGLENTGNISSVPLGFISIFNKNKKLVAAISINPKHLPIKPNNKLDLTVDFDSEGFIIGDLSADLSFGFANTQYIRQPSFLRTLNLFYIGKLAIIIIALAIFFILLILITNPKHQHNLLHHTGALFVLILAFVLLFYCYNWSSAPSRNYLGTNEINLQATVSEQLAMTTFISSGGQQEVQIFGNNSMGAILWSLQNENRILLDEVISYGASIESFLLTGIAKRFPILILTRGY